MEDARAGHTTQQTGKEEEQHCVHEYCDAQLSVKVVTFSTQVYCKLRVCQEMDPPKKWSKGLLRGRLEGFEETCEMLTVYFWTNYYFSPKITND